MNRKLPIFELMTPSPHTIASEMTLSKAQEMMRDHHIRHLPVQHGGKLVGVLTERDVRLAFSVHPSAKDLPVDDVMVEEPYSVEGETPTIDVLKEMVAHKYGCAIIRNKQGRAIGIFTLLDAAAALARVLSAEGSDR